MKKLEEIEAHLDQIDTRMNNIESSLNTPHPIIEGLLDLVTISLLFGMVVVIWLIVETASG